jgi:hypothetical protein
MSHDAGIAAASTMPASAPRDEPHRIDGMKRPPGSASPEDTTMRTR